MKMTKTERRKLAARYPKFVEWSDEDACFIGRCPLLFGYSGKFLVRVQPALHQRLALKALASGESLNSLVARKLASG